MLNACLVRLVSKLLLLMLTKLAPASTAEAFSISLVASCCRRTPPNELRRRRRAHVQRSAVNAWWQEGGAQRSSSRSSGSSSSENKKNTVGSVRPTPSEVQVTRLKIKVELTMFSLLLSELDGIPVAAHVRDATTESATAAPLLTHGTQTSAWPYLALVPSFSNGKKIVKDLCVAQIIGLWQFRQVACIYILSVWSS
jgi:hypothetical protein